jgi:hypothetical protein
MAFHFFGYTARFIIWSETGETNKQGYEQLCISNSAEATTKLLENPSNQGRTAELIQRLDEMRHVKASAELYKRIYQMK